MSFLQPWMLVALGGAAVPIIIHLIYKRKPRRQAFAAIEFVLRSVERVERRWRLKRFLLLASRVLILAALAFAAARPLFGTMAAATHSSSGPRDIAIVIDSSLSMRAEFEGRSAFARARTLVANLMDGLGPEDRAVLVFAGHSPVVFPEQPTAERRKLIDALDRAEPGFDHVDLADAISSAAKALGSNEPPPEGAAKVGKKIVVFSDLSGHAFRSSADLVVPGTEVRASLELINVLEDVDDDERVNRAITRLELKNVPGEAPRTVEARARIRAFSADKGDSDPIAVSLHDAQAELRSGSVEIVGGTIADKSLIYSFETPGLAPVSMRLEGDALREDNVRYGIADVRREVRVLIVDGAPSGVPKEDEVFYLERALYAGARDQPPPRIITADDLTRTDLAAFEVVMLVGVPTLGREDAARLVEFVEKGGGLFVSVCEDLDLALYNAALEPVLPRRLRSLKRVDPEAAGSSGPVALSAPESEHSIVEIFAGEALEGLTTARTDGYVLLEPDGRRPAEVILSFDDGQPALVGTTHGKGLSLLLTTSLDRDLSDLAIRPAFLPLIRRSLLYLGRALSKQSPVETLVGDARKIELAPGVRRLEVTAPDGQTRLFSKRELSESETISFSETRRPGHYQVRVASAGGFETSDALAFSVNVDARESDLRSISIEEATTVLLGTGRPSEGTRIAALARLGKGGWSNPETLATILLVLMLMGFLLESALTMQKKREASPTPSTQG